MIKRRSWQKPWLFFFSDFPILSTIPNLLHAFSVHLMNCYFTDFWYSHVTEKKTSEGRNAICEKNRISYGSKVHCGNRWRNGWLSIWKKSHSEYRELQVKAMRIVDENPALRILINSMEGIVLTPEDHKALHKLKNAHRLFLFLHINRTCIQIRLCNAEGFFNLP